MMSAKKAKAALKKASDPVFKQTVQGFFKCGKGQYSEGDIFIGVSKPKINQIAKAFHALTFSELKVLLNSKIHEDRVLALQILNQQYRAAKVAEQGSIFKFYVKFMHRVNNWDLVDLSAPVIVGQTLLQGDKSLLYQWAQSPNVWIRRVAIVSTLHFIRQGEVTHALKLARILLSDSHDLMHKAVGWMLREVGKKNESSLSIFLDRNLKRMPRTTLRYAIERLPKQKRQHFLLR